MSLIALRKPRSDHATRDCRFEQINYEKSAPFFENPAGVLIHRVKALYSLRWKDRDKDPWWIVDYWCCNTGRSESIDDGLLFDPGKKLVCARCEALAVAAGEKTSSQIARRHVCIGECRPVNVCPRHAPPA